MPTGSTLDLGDKIRVSPAIWPGRALDVQPGDLSKFVPYRKGYYEGQDRRKGSNPFTGAPIHEACGGVIYFRDDVTKADFEALMRIMRLQPKGLALPSKRFAVFIAESKRPSEDGYFAQMRVVSDTALRDIFRALADAEWNKFPEQEMTMVEALWSFIEQARRRLEDSAMPAMFETGDARHDLAFGFMVEADNHQVYRIWSREWLVHK
jgi:hypothetical protein